MFAIVDCARFVKESSDSARFRQTLAENLERETRKKKERRKKKREKENQK